MSVVKKLQRNLNNFSIDIEDWEILDHGVTILWGPSGAGKTTVLHALLGLDELADVEWVWGEEVISDQAPGERNLGVVFQEPGLFPSLSVEKNILFPVDKNKHKKWQEDYSYLVEALEIEHCLKSSVHEISGGEKQRVAMARALIYRPRMLLLDEPFSSLDERLKEKSRKILKDLSQELSCPILMVTHDQADVSRLADQVTQIEDGRILRS